MRFRKRPVEVDAVQLRWDTWNEMCEHADVGELKNGKPEGGWIDPKRPGVIHHGPTPPPNVSPDEALIGLAIPTLEGLMVATQDDWVIRGVKGELYPCKPEIFAATYEPVA